MRTMGAVAITAAVLCGLIACGSDDSADSHTQLSAATSAESGDRGFDDATLAAFVASFRTGYPNLAEGRNDPSIEHIAIEPCIDLANGADKQTVTATITTWAENDGTVPTADQAEQIYLLVVPTCP